jgi:hypothetical protein
MTGEEDDVIQNVPSVAPGKAPAASETRATKSKKSQQADPPVWAIHAECPTQYDANLWEPKKDWKKSHFLFQCAVISRENPKQALCLYCKKVSLHDATYDCDMQLISSRGSQHCLTVADRN